MLLNGTPIGPLDITEVYAFHDGPRLFRASSRIGTEYLMVWSEFDSESETWLCAKVSPRRISMLHSGEIDLRDAFAAAEEGFVWRARHVVAADIWTLEATSVTALKDEWLPLAGEKLSLPPPETQQLADDELLALARGSRRDALAVSLYFARRYDHEAPARELGVFLGAFQETLDVLGQSKRGKTGRGGGVLPDVREQTEMLVESTYRSSFGVRLVAASQPDLAGESLAAVSFDDLCDLLESENEKLRSVLATKSSQVASKYRRLIEALVDAEAAVAMTWQRPSGHGPRRSTMSLDRAKEVLAIVSEVRSEDMEILRLDGVLAGGNVYSKSFQLKVGNQRYAGRVLPSAMSSFATATLSKAYRATLHAVVEISTATGAERTEYSLAELDPI